MTLDCDKYRLCVPTVKIMGDRLSSEDRLKDIGKMSLATGAPIIVVGYYLAELYGMNEELDALIGRLKSFYGINEVLNYRG